MLANKEQRAKKVSSATIEITQPIAGTQVSQNFPVAGNYSLGGFQVTSKFRIQVELIYDNTPDSPEWVPYFPPTNAANWSCTFDASRATEDGETATLIAYLYQPNSDGSIDTDPIATSDAVGGLTITSD